MLRNMPSLYKLEDLIKQANESSEQCGLPDGRWVPVRYMGYYNMRNEIYYAWLVFTGKADAVVWPGQ